MGIIVEKFVYNPIMDKNYIGILTVLDYETSVRKCLSSILVGTQNRIERKVIVDLALKVGVNEYRFVVYDITDDGKILWNSSKYITPCEDIVKLANSFIRQKSDILSNSMLSNVAQAICKGTDYTECVLDADATDCMPILNSPDSWNLKKVEQNCKEN